MEKNSGKTLAAKILAMVLIVSVAGIFSACKKKSKIPTKEEFLNEHINDPDPHGVKKLDFNREDLIKAWGEPDADKSRGSSYVWKCGDKFIIVGADPDDLNKIEEMYVSFTQELVYLFSNASIIYVSARQDGVTDYHNCIMVEEMYFDKETLASLEIGTILEIEFDGYFLETYPGQLSNLYSVKATGKVDESEIPALREQEQYIRENYTGEQ